MRRYTAATFPFLFVLLALLVISPAPAINQSGCGIEPIKPIPPIGCQDLRAECVCDEHGQNCHWRWVCVPVD